MPRHSTACKLLTLLVLFFFNFVFVEGQANYNISGTVKDTNNAVVSGAIVKAISLTTNKEITAVTNSSGEYTFTNLAPGTYRITVELSGFANAARTVTLTNKNSVQDFSLTPGIIRDEVTVTAGKGSARVAVEVPQTVTITTSEDIEKQRPRSTFEAIERTPNIIVRETNPSRERPRLRGLDSSRVLIVIDGERLNNARTDLQTGLSPSIVDVSQLESIEVVSGAGASLYGSDAIGGTINLITKATERPRQGFRMGFRLDGNYSSNGEVARGNGVFNLSNKNIAFRAGYSQFSLVDYTTGNKAITLADTIAIGEFYKSFPTGSTGSARQSAANFPIFSVPANGQIFNGGGRGYNAQGDLWFFPVTDQSFRLRYIDSLHKKLGDAFSGPPYETQERFNAFRQFKKFSARYEGLELTKWLPRLSINYYHQKLSFPQSQYEYIINSGSSFTGNTFTGNPSTFTIRTFTDNKNTVTSDAIDGQVNLQPITGVIVTLGGGTLIDSSKDEFNRYFVDPTSPIRAALPNTPSTPAIFGGASAPNTRYTDNNFYVLGDLDRFRLFRISLSLRVDNWKTKASPSQSFPLGSEFAVLNAAIPALQANPNPLQSQLEALPKLTQLAGRTGNVTTSNFSYTGGIGVVFRLPFGVNPYFKFSNSYREGSLTERYLIRNFPAFPGLVAIVVGNPNIKPEKGKNYEAGIKVQNNFFQGSLGYFRNDLTDLIRFQTPDVGNLCVTANPSAGLLPLNAIFAPLAGCAVGQSAISFNGRSNLSSATISGFEGTAEASIPLSGLGSINPFLSFGTLSGTNKSPNALQIRIINELYNRGDTPLKLKGTILDVPLGNITPLRMIGGLNFSDTKGRFYAEYSFRYQSRVERADPSSFVGTTLINYGTFASLNSIFKQTIKGGYAWKNDKYRFSINAGIDNLTDRLYWEHFQNAPAPGRSFIIGFTTEFFNLLNNK